MAYSSDIGHKAEITPPKVEFHEVWQFFLVLRWLKLSLQEYNRDFRRKSRELYWQKYNLNHSKNISENKILNEDINWTTSQSCH